MKRSHNSILPNREQPCGTPPRWLRARRVTVTLPLLNSDTAFNWIPIKIQTVALAAVTSGAHLLLRLCQPGQYLQRPALPGALWEPGEALSRSDER